MQIFKIFVWYKMVNWKLWYKWLERCIASYTGPCLVTPNIHYIIYCVVYTITIIHTLRHTLKHTWTHSQRHKHTPLDTHTHKIKLHNSIQDQFHIKKGHLMLSITVKPLMWIWHQAFDIFWYFILDHQFLCQLISPSYFHLMVIYGITCPLDILYWYF